MVKILFHVESTDRKLSVWQRPVAQEMLLDQAFYEVMAIV